MLTAEGFAETLKTLLAKVKYHNVVSMEDIRSTLGHCH